LVSRQGVIEKLGKNRGIGRNNGTFVRAGECQLREQTVHEKPTANSEELKKMTAVTSLTKWDRLV